MKDIFYICSMKIKILVLDNYEDELKKEINSPERLEELRIQSLIGGKTNEASTIEFDLQKFYKEVDLYLKESSIEGVYISPILHDGQKVMIIFAFGREFSSIYNAETFEKLNNLLESN